MFICEYADIVSFDTRLDSSVVSFLQDVLSIVIANSGSMQLVAERIITMNQL